MRIILFYPCLVIPVARASSLINELKTLRVEQPWIDEKTYRAFVAEAWDMIDSVKSERDEACKTVSRDTTTLVDAFNTCFGKLQSGLKRNIEVLFQKSCELGISNSSPPTLSKLVDSSPSDVKSKSILGLFKSRKSHSPIQPDTPPEEDFNLLHKLIKDGFVNVFHHTQVEDVCIAPTAIPKTLKPVMRCPVIHDRVDLHDLDRFGFEDLDFGDDRKLSLLQVYANLVNRDCIVHNGIDQILRDHKRIGVAEYLKKLISEENQEKSYADIGAHDESFAAAAAAAGAGMEPTEEYTREYTKSFQGTVSDISIVNQFDSEIRQLFDTCSEVAAVYSFIARNTASPMNAFYFGRPMYGHNSGGRWRKFSYPRTQDRFPFHYYQGIADVCYHVMIFERIPSPPGLSSKGTRAHYPSKSDMFNVIATVVEDIHDLPLGPAVTVRDPYYEDVAQVLFRAPDEPVAGSESFGISRGQLLSSMIIRSFIDQKESINFKALPPDGTPMLKKLWSFVFKHGHYGMLAFIAAAERIIAQREIGAPDLVNKIITPLTALDSKGEFEKAIRISNDLLATSVQSRDSPPLTFSEFIDEVELESILEVRP